MKATKLLLVTALFAGLATLSFAGPGPQFWAAQAQNQKEQQIKAAAKAQPATEAPKGMKVCTTCGCPDMKKS